MASDQWAGVSRVVSIAIVVSCAPLASAQKVSMPWEIPCDKERVQPNLVLKSNKHVYGELKDPTGAVFEKSKLVVRRQAKKGQFIDYRITLTDASGRFDLKSVEPGLYRFLPGPNRGWKQPKEVSCSESSECEIKLVLDLNPTDQPFAQCPIK